MHGKHDVQYLAYANLQSFPHGLWSIVKKKYQDYSSTASRVQGKHTVSRVFIDFIHSSLKVIKITKCLFGSSDRPGHAIKRPDIRHHQGAGLNPDDFPLTLEIYSYAEL
jgi:hypothetical protein